jgi:predicted GNAT family N-acyltransferase
VSTVKTVIHDLNYEVNLINPVMRPEEIRIGDPIACKVRLVTGDKNVRLWSYCPFGFEFIDADTVYNIGESYKFFITLGKTNIEFDGSVVFVKSRSNADSTIGIRINYNVSNLKVSSEDRRIFSRWNCPEHLLPTGTAPNPTRYNDFILFRVVDISSKGLKLAISLRNKLLAVGQILECTLSVPMIGTLYAAVKINRVAIESVQGKEQLILGVSFIKPDEVISTTLSEYLLTFAEDCSVSSLREAGFQGTLGTSQFDFSYSKSSKDYDDVLQLRFDAYQDSGKLSQDLSRDFMRDDFDARSRILTVKLAGKLIGSARAMFHEQGDGTSHERYLTYPEGFPSIAECLEVSRVCVKPDFQGVGLAHELAKHLALLTIKAGRKYIYLSASDSLKGFWLEIGFKDTGARYIHKQLSDLEHSLLINNVEESILGKNIGAKAWLNSYEHLYQHCVDYGLIEPSTVDQIRIQSFKTFRKFF